jgi:hypothetical protein
MVPRSNASGDPSALKILDFGIKAQACMEKPLLSRQVVHVQVPARYLVCPFFSRSHHLISSGFDEEPEWYGTKRSDHGEDACEDDAFGGVI